MMAKTVFITAWFVTLVIGALLMMKVWQLHPVYISATVRDDFKKILALYRYDTGVGLSNLKFRKIICQEERCQLFLTYKYRGKPETAQTYSLTIDWPLGQPHQYVIIQS